MKRALLAVALALMLVVAGCNTTDQGGDSTTVETTGEPTDVQTTAEQTDTQTSEPTQTTTSDEDQEDQEEPCEYRSEESDLVQVQGACLGFDANQVYLNVMEMAGVELDQGPSVRSLSPEQTNPYTFDQFGFNNESFQAVMGIAPEGTPDVFVAGYASPQTGPDGSVEVDVVMRYINASSGEGRAQGPEEAEITLAHEFLHAIQFYEGSQDRLAANLTSEGVNLDNVETSLVEGSAVFFESEYQEQYMDRDAASRDVSAWANSSPFSMYQLGPYVMGERYTKFRVNSTSEFQTLYDNPPISMEQIMHNHMPDEERPLDLSVERGQDSVWNHYSTSTRGELFLRSSLRAGVSGPRAAAGADGWGTDRVMVFKNQSYGDASKYGYAWTLRFDNASEQDEFRSIFGDWLESRGPLSDGVYRMDEDQTYRMVEISDETVVVLAGHERFTTRTVATGNSSHVTVTMTDADQTNSSVQSDDDEERLVTAQAGAVRAAV
ncbi:hypothetical protein [Haloarchaeobius iranensis]|uniref:Uncharacterized protein n=1 Tax=Haloarchaeobius iranensis TaxID=996166 RepID=A0A1G9Z2N8_9EURY|nr:hypothetical protein [Haloarchaeobius iranensis]SDN15021.1 hypothetical protein SAMN05192554_11745 [Haloarchaeobius iranensis]